MPTTTSPCACDKALWIQFMLCQPLFKSSPSVCARVLSYWQGDKPSSDDCDGANCASACDGVGDTTMPTVCVNNLSDGSGGYVFVGSKGDVGLASYDDREDKYRIVSWKSCQRQ